MSAATEQLELREKIRHLADKANDAKQEWTADDESQWDALNARFDELDGERRQERRSRIGREDRRGEPGGTGAGLQDRIGNGPAFRCAETGREIRALTAQERFSDKHRDEPVPSIGGVIADLLTGRSNHCGDELRLAIGSSDSGGGYILTPSMSSQVVDLARSASVALRAGASTLPMDTAEMTVARLTGDPTASWRPEGVAVSASAMTFDRVTLRARTLAAIVPVSIELLEDASNIAQIIESALRSQLGLKLDQAVLRGAGADSEPLGILNHAGVNSIGSVGALSDYSDITAAVGDIYGANYPGEPDGLSVIMHPREGETLDALEDSTGQPLQPTPWAAATRKLMTTSLSITEGGGAESSMIVGDFSQCVIGMRTTGVVIRVASDGSVSSGSTTYNATSQLLRHVVAYLRADLTLLRPTWFTKLTGVTA